MAPRRPPSYGDDLVRLDPLAALELAEIFTNTSYQWGEEQAERYAELIQRTVYGLARYPQSGHPVIGHAKTRACFVRWRRARHGHYIVYRPTDQGIYVLRILHSAMDLASHLEMEDEAGPDDDN